MSFYSLLSSIPFHARFCIAHIVEGLGQYRPENINTSYKQDGKSTPQSGCILNSLKTSGIRLRVKVVARISLKRDFPLD